jgi:hypothetical protein
LLAPPANVSLLRLALIQITDLGKTQEERGVFEIASKRKAHCSFDGDGNNVFAQAGDFEIAQPAQGWGNVSRKQGKAEIEMCSSVRLHGQVFKLFTAGRHQQGRAASYTDISTAHSPQAGVASVRQTSSKPEVASPVRLGEGTPHTT